MAQKMLGRISGLNSGHPVLPSHQLSIHAPSSAARVAAFSMVIASRWRQSLPFTELGIGARFARRGGGKRRAVCATALPDPHSVSILADWMHPHSHPATPDLGSVLFLADWLSGLVNPKWFEPNLDLSELPMRIDLDPSRLMETTESNWALSLDQIKTFYMAFALIFAWGCCVFGSMNDEFYDGDLYRNDGGNGTGHWIYDKQARDEEEAREEMWMEDLATEIEATQIEEKVEELVKL